VNSASFVDPLDGTCGSSARPARILAPVFRMTVAGVFSIRGRGTVVSGRVEEGSVRVGDEVQLGGMTLRVDGIEASRKQVEEAHAGADAGLLFGALDKGAVSRGDTITAG
jgi:elongation factor Tu